MSGAQDPGLLKSMRRSLSLGTESRRSNRSALRLLEALFPLEGQIAVKRNAIRALTPTHFAVPSYLTAVSRWHGLIRNVAKPKLDFDRFVVPGRSA